MRCVVTYLLAVKVVLKRTLILVQVLTVSESQWLKISLRVRTIILFLLYCVQLA
jgi:hypothetical protein